MRRVHFQLPTDKFTHIRALEYSLCVISLKKGRPKINIGWHFMPSMPPSRLLLAGLGMPAELFFAETLYHPIDDLDRLGDGLIGVRGVGLPDKKLDIVADLKPGKTLFPGYTLRDEEVFRPVSNR